MKAAQQAGDPALEGAGWVSLACAAVRLEDARLAQQAIDAVLRLTPLLHSPQAQDAVYSGLASAYNELGLAACVVQLAQRAQDAAGDQGDTACLSLARTKLLTGGCLACEILEVADPPPAQAQLADWMPQLEQRCVDGGPARSPMAQARCAVRIEAGQGHAAAALTHPRGWPTSARSSARSSRSAAACKALANVEAAENA